MRLIYTKKNWWPKEFQQGETIGAYNLRIRQGKQCNVLITLIKSIEGNQVTNDKLFLLTQGSKYVKCVSKI